MEEKKNKVVLPIILTLVAGLAVGTGTGYLIFRNTMGLTEEEKKLIEGYRLLKEEWLFGNEEKEFSTLALNGMITSISDNQGDPYTFYTENREAQGLSVDSRGFGFSTHSYDGGLYISEIHPDSPAEKSRALKIGDVLVSVKRNEEEVYDFSSHTSTEIRDYLSEKVSEDDSFLFTVKRGDAVFTVKLQKGDYSERLVRVLSAPTEENKNTLTVKINTFLGDPVSALKGTLQQYESRAKKLVFDLRGNGGGYVAQAEAMAKMFVKKGTMIDAMVDKNGKTLSSCYQKENPEYDFSEYGIIIDSNSASASESFTLAMRAGTNCTVYGFKSYGKGIAQSFKYFSDKSVIRYTYAYVYGQERENETMYDEGKDNDKVLCIHKKGIVPDKTYTPDYTPMALIADYTTSIAISEYGQQFFLNALNMIYPSVYPASYSADYHFTDAIRQYSISTAKKYSDDSYLNAFSSSGAMDKKLNDRFVKECYDYYLKGYDDLTAFAENN